MFILYINDLDSVVTDSVINVYANDETLYYANSSFVELMLTIRDE